MLKNDRDDHEFFKNIIRNIVCCIQVFINVSKGAFALEPRFDELNFVTALTQDRVHHNIAPERDKALRHVIRAALSNKNENLLRQLAALKDYPDFRVTPEMSLLIDSLPGFDSTGFTD